MSASLPTEVLSFLVRTLSPREVWTWLSEDEQLQLRARVARGFRATAEVLRQPAARARLMSHLEKTPEDLNAIIAIWENQQPPVLQEVCSLGDDLIANLPKLQNQYGAEALLLALAVAEREDALEAITDLTQSDEGATESETEIRIVAAPETDSAEIEKLRRIAAREEKKAIHWREKYKELQTQSSQTEKTLRDKINELEKQARDTARVLKVESHRANIAETRLLESEKARERVERRAKSTLAEVEESSAQLKTARRQLQRLQQINEEQRRQLLAAQSQHEDRKPRSREDAESTFARDEDKEVQISSRVPGFRSSRSENESAGQVQKIAAAIDRNDEAFIATLRRDLAALRKHDIASYSEFLKKVRHAGKYYERVLTNETSRVFVDASNVVRLDAGNRGKLSYLTDMREELRRFDFFPIIFIADASLPFHIDEPKKLREMIARGEVLLTTSGQQADEILAREARATGGYVVTNDRNFHYAFAPDFVPMRIGFRIEAGIVLLEDF